ncbi:hypothetical protein [Desulfosporosinus sp. BICA1-9]|uniref:hypothetical protein n=1 Tax=Desulfosporosinus sp. BICA1-9 TaxID=1531958 RepID=UPI000A53E763|nr:hypothetical protein [Desulfosporosinus sp. BICA1-9]
MSDSQEKISVQEILRQRVSLRQYADWPVKDDDIMTIIEGADRREYDDVFDDYSLGSRLKTALERDV